MSTIVTRAGKGSPLTNNEVDANFTNLNTDKLESADLSGYALLTGATFTGEVEATGFNGDLTGAILFKGQAGEALTKGDPAYISGISGNKTIVSKADANDASKMPCFGIVDATVSANADCSIVTFGTLQGLDTSSFSEGDELYISDTGTLTTTAPTGEASQIQKIGKVTRSHASTGSIKVMGAGRTNATPNLDDGNFFLGNGSNQSVSADFETSVTGIALPLTGGALTGAVTTTSTFDGRDVATDGTKLDTIETNADVTDTANVTAAGALMDSEVTNLAQVKAFDSADYATAAQGTTADAALPKAGGAMTGEIAMGTSKITGLGDPTAAQDAATKAYVDAGGGGGGETLQETLAIGNTVATDTKIQFRDTGLFINSSADGQLDIVADTEVQLGATTFDINAAVVTSGDVTVGDDLSLLSDSSRLNFGLDNDVNLTHIHNAGLLLNTTRRLYFNGTNNNIYAPSTTTLDINANSEIELNAPLIDVNGSLDVSGSITIAGGITEDSVTLSGTTVNIFLSSGTNFIHSLIGNTTYNFTNHPSAGNAAGFTLKIVQSSTPRTVTWPSNVDWAGGVAPTLTTTSGGVDIFVFYTPDGGSTYYGFTAGQAMA